jgi:hypothetical protein
VLAATNLIYHFPPLMIALGELAARPDWVTEPTIDRPVFRGLMLRPEMLAKLGHFVLASAAAAGVALMFISRRATGTSSSNQATLRLIATGARLALGASLAQVLVGVWLLTQMPPSASGALFGEDWLASGLFVISIGGILTMLHSLAHVSLNDTSAHLVRRVCVLLVVVVVSMTAAQARSRQVAASDWPFAARATPLERK